MRISISTHLIAVTVYCNIQLLVIHVHTFSAVVTKLLLLLLYLFTV